jgi:hypothetical protein
MAIHEKSKVKKDGFGVTVQRIVNCARCGESHEQLWFSRFTRPVVCDGMVNNYWAICPVVLEPIFMAIVSEQEG